MFSLPYRARQEVSPVADTHGDLATLVTTPVMLPAPIEGVAILNHGDTEISYRAYVSSTQSAKQLRFAVPVGGFLEPSGFLEGLRNSLTSTDGAGAVTLSYRQPRDGSVRDPRVFQADVLSAVLDHAIRNPQIAELNVSASGADFIPHSAGFGAVGLHALRHFSADNTIVALAPSALYPMQFPRMFEQRLDKLIREGIDTARAVLGVAELRKELKEYTFANLPLLGGEAIRCAFSSENNRLLGQLQLSGTPVAVVGFHDDHVTTPDRIQSTGAKYGVPFYLYSEKGSGHAATLNPAHAAKLTHLILSIQDDLRNPT